MTTHVTIFAKSEAAFEVNDLKTGTLVLRIKTADEANYVGIHLTEATAKALLRVLIPAVVGDERPSAEIITLAQAAPEPPEAA